MEMSDTFYHLLDFDIDTYINPWIPHNRLYILPQFIAHWLGYRRKPVQEPPAALQWPITFLATVAGLCLVGGIGSYAPGIADLHPPVLIASLGASAILGFNTINSPLSQPRNAVIGNTLAAICGVAIAKLFQLNADFDNLEWVSGAVGCALASLVMSLTNTIHPPGGATAVLASTQAQAIAMGWRFVPLVLLDSTLLILVALIFNNLLRQYPTYWWTSQDVGRTLRHRGSKDEEAKEDKPPASAERSPSVTSSERTLRRTATAGADPVHGIDDVVISPYKLLVPALVVLTDAETALLETLQERIRSNKHS